MKQIYQAPQTTVVILNVTGHYMEETIPIGQSRVTDGQLGKETAAEVEDDCILPTQPNLWADDED